MAAVQNIGFLIQVSDAYSWMPASKKQKLSEEELVKIRQKYFFEEKKHE